MVAMLPLYEQPWFTFKGARSMQAKVWTDEERAQRQRLAVEGNFAARLVPGYHGTRWTDEELGLLDTLSDAQVAAQIGRTVAAVKGAAWPGNLPPLCRGREGRRCDGQWQSSGTVPAGPR
jgi:hypothetical protein